MKDFWLGFSVATCVCLAGFIAWEYIRYVPVVVKPVPVPVSNGSKVPELSPVITE
tara:strand:- start:2123 stop:2287 length:165 start_codon:yes stop_codon:yes gene_type:complete